MLAQPVSEKLIGDAKLSCGVFDPFQMNRCKPCIINLFWHFSLDIGQGVLPFVHYGHIPCIILRTQTYSHLWITWFFAPILVCTYFVIRR